MTDSAQNGGGDHDPMDMDGSDAISSVNSALKEAGSPVRDGDNAQMGAGEENEREERHSDENSESSEESEYCDDDEDGDEEDDAEYDDYDIEVPSRKRASSVRRYDERSIFLPTAVIVAIMMTLMMATIIENGLNTSY